MATIQLDIVSPDKGEILSKEIDMLIVRSTAGTWNFAATRKNVD